MLIGLIDLALYAGFNVQAISTITKSGTTATVTTSATHNYISDQVLLISGATGGDASLYNGEFTITVTGATTYTYTMTGTPSADATGTLTGKVAPLGWEKPYSTTNKAVYRSPNTGSSRHYFQINDSTDTLTVTRGSTWNVSSTAGCYAAEIRLYSDMSALDTGTELGRSWLFRGDASYTNAPPVVIVGDDTTVHIWIRSQVASYSWGNAYAFGDFIPFNPLDKPSFILGCPAISSAAFFNSQASYAPPFYTTNPYYTDANIWPFIILGVGSSGEANASYTTGGIGGLSSRLNYPGVNLESVDRIFGGQYAAQFMVCQQWPVIGWRGLIPGAYNMFWTSAVDGFFATPLVINSTTRRMSHFRLGYTSVLGGFAVDITGPWR